MEPTLRNGRIVGPVPYLKDGAKRVNIPLGPCLVERIDAQRVDVIWGASGQRSAIFSIKELETVTSSGHLVLLEAFEWNERRPRSPEQATSLPPLLHP